MGCPQDNTTTPNSEVSKLNGNDPNRRIGPSIILKVMAGDTIQAAVRAYYKENTNPKKKASILAEQMLAGLLRAVTAPGLQASVTHNARFAPNARTTDPGLTAADFQSLRQKDPNPKALSKPKAYLNFVFFDKQLNFVKEGSGVKQVDGEAGELQTLSSGKIVAKQDGYVYVFTSNESQQDVFFDNLGVTQVTGPVLEETHYYPFGLTMAGISTVAPLKITNKYKFNSIEFNRNEFSDGSGLELYTATYRGLDPQLGRWWQIDPMASSFAGMSPYVAMGNNPLLYSDPNGDCIVCFVVAAVIGASINAATHWDQITAGGQFHWGKFGAAVGIGAAAGIVGVATGGAAFAAAGGAAAGAGGFLAGAAAGAVSSAYATGIKSVGNAIAFGDPLPTPEQFVTGIAFGALTGGVFNGVSATLNGRNFWNGNLSTQGFQLQQLGGGVGFRVESSKDIDIPQGAVGNPRNIRANSIVKNYSNRPSIKVKTLTYSGKQINHLSKELGGRFGSFNPPKSYMTANPTKVLNDLNSGNFQIVGRALRGNIIVRFNYTIGNSYNKFGAFLGPTKNAVLHLNGSGEVHLVPWIAK